MPIFYAVASLSGIGLVLGVLLAAAGKYLTVEQDERVPEIIDVLPSANCGGCGYAGCGAFAEAVVKGEASVSGCTVGGNETSKKVAEIMGVKASEKKPMVAKVLCCGTDDAVKIKYEYEDIMDCDAAHRLGGGQKACSYGCLGFGNCVRECPFDAIELKDGVALVTEKCVGCEKCVAVCPKKIIKMVPKSAEYIVACSSKDKGAAMKDKCSVGCIGCKICEKNCPEGAFTVNDNLAVINYDIDGDLSLAAEKCPKKVIINCNIKKSKV